MKLNIFLSFFLFLSHVYALEIDEKLTTRFLKVSRTKKTVLINRGLEDGLVVGDHAKFFLTTGVIARGVVVKASPTRSIWSIYRIITDDRIIPDSVVNIKITKPIQTTTDPTRSLYDNSNATMTAGTEVMTTRGDTYARRGSPGVVQTEDNLTKDDRQELEALGTTDMAGFPVAEAPGMHPDRTLEAFGLIHFNSLSSSVDEGDSGGSYVGEDANVDFSIGLEKYFNNPQSFLSRVSFFAFLHNSSNSVTSAQGRKLSSSVLEYGVGAHFHYMAPALSYNRLIGFAGVSLGVGSVSDTREELGSTTTLENETIDGSSSFLSLATGVKYYTRGGFGARAMIDFYRRSESYPFEEGDSFTKVVSGPRLLLGLSYRF